MYTNEEKLRAIKMFIEGNRKVSSVINALGYPAPNILKHWVKEYEKEGKLPEHKTKYTAKQKEDALTQCRLDKYNLSCTSKKLGIPRSTLSDWIRSTGFSQKMACVVNTSMLKLTEEQKAEIIAQRYETGTPYYKIAAEYGVSETTVRKWEKHLLERNSSEMNGEHIEKDESSKTSTDMDSMLSELEQLRKRREELAEEVKNLELRKDVLTKVSELIKKGKGINLETLSNKEKSEVIDALRNRYSLKALLHELQISKSSYCYQRAVSKAGDKYLGIRTDIKRIFKDSKETYGYRRVYAILSKEGNKHSEKVVRRIMDEESLHPKRTHMRKYSSYLGEISPAVENLVDRDFHSDAPNKLWLTDITQFSIPAGKVYLSPMIDCFDGMAVSWTIGCSPNAQLANCMLDAAIKQLGENEHPVVHSDRGCHYRWPGWIERMENAGLTRSMSRKGCSPDNAACEGFFGRLKNEIFYGKDWSNVSIESFIQHIDQYMQWYNQQRIKVSLNGMSPIEYRKSLGLML